ncbi:MAG: BON domain-containing protein [Acidobacteriota bacterium]|nr:MAG: BON domain-containing protein [Acidobacteriota bacterium]
MSRKLAVFALLLILAIGLAIGLTPQGRSWTGSLMGWWRGADDKALSDQVKAAFALSRRLSAYQIEVAARDGIVTLTGQVPTEIDKELAGNVARDVPDVQNVDNQLQVQPGLKPSEASVREGMRVSDLEIRANLNEKLLSSEILKGQSIQVAVEERIVTLNGRVDNPIQKAGADQLAQSIPNVVKVVNNLEVVNPGASREETPGVPAASKDKDLANRVLFAFFQSREDFADIGSIKAASREGSVVLTGAVASRAERALAERIARDVDGVKSVSNQLTVSQK